jgi:hypothetical protein
MPSSWRWNSERIALHSAGSRLAIECESENMYEVFERA